MLQNTLGENRDGSGTLWAVCDVSGDPRGGPGRVGRPLRKSGTGQGTLPEVQDRLGSLGEVCHGSGYPPRSPGMFGDPPGGRG